MKRSILITSLLLFSFALVLIFSKQFATNNEKKLITYKKVKTINGETVVHYPTTSTEKQAMNKTDTATKKREPASIKSSSDLTSDDPIQEQLKERIANSSLFFMKEGTKLVITGHKQQPPKDDPRYLNKKLVDLTYIKPNGMIYSHSALIDVETGLTTLMWNQTRYENFRGTKEGFVKHPWIQAQEDELKASSQASQLRNP